MSQSPLELERRLRELERRQAETEMLTSAIAFLVVSAARGEARRQGQGLLAELFDQALQELMGGDARPPAPRLHIVREEQDGGHDA